MNKVESKLAVAEKYNQITDVMVTELNSELAVMGCSFRFKLIDEGFYTKIQVTMASMNFVGSCIINLTEEFRVWLYQWFKIRGVHLTTNNTGSIYWGVEKEA